jgi:hypothetical protein
MEKLFEAAIPFTLICIAIYNIELILSIKFDLFLHQNIVKNNFLRT